MHCYALNKKEEGLIEEKPWKLVAKALLNQALQEENCGNEAHCLAIDA